MRELTRKTPTADSRIGSHSETSGVITTSGSGSASTQPRESQQRTAERNNVQRLPEPRPVRPPSDPRRKLRRGRRTKGNLLKRKHLADEEHRAPHTHHDIGAKRDQQQAADHAVIPGQEERRENEDGDRRV